MERTATLFPDDEPSANTPPKRAPRQRIRRDGNAAREEAFVNLHVWRHFYIRRFEHSVLEHLLTHDKVFAPDLADQLEIPVPIRKVFVGGAMNELARRGLIRKAPDSPRYTTQNGRHGRYSEVWRLAVDAATVAEWRRTHPVPPAPEQAEVDP
jgi:hypothetical protein